MGGRDDYPAFGTPNSAPATPRPPTDAEINAKNNPTDPYAGTSYADSNYGTDAARGGATGHTDARDFMYGRTANYASDTAAAERATAGVNATALAYGGEDARNTAAVLGTRQAAYGLSNADAGQGLGNREYLYAGAQGQAGHINAANLQNLGQTSIAQGAAAQGRAGAQADYSGAQAALRRAQSNAGTLTNIEATQGPSGAQAQLQSGINASEASNLAMARSGRGWGGSATALSQAANANAAATQNAANSSAQLSASEDAAYRQRQAANMASAAGIQQGVGAQLGQQSLSQAQLQQQTAAQNDAAQIALNQQGLNAYGAGVSGYNQATDAALQGMGQGAGVYNQSTAIGQQGLAQGAGTVQAGETLGMQGLQASEGAYAQGETMAGTNMSAQAQGDMAREGEIVQHNAIDAGLAVNAQQQNSAMWGTALGVTGAVIGTALGGPAGGAAGAAGGAAAGGAIGSDIRVKSDIAPLDASTSEDDRDAARGAAARSMLGSTLKEIGSGAKRYAAESASGAGAGTLSQFEAMGHPQGAAYGQTPMWGNPEQGPLVTSDEDEKSGVHESAALDMVDQAPGYSYYYKDPERHGEGEHYGPMAQDLLKTPAGASTVERTPDGTLAVNGGRLALAQHAAMHSMRRENSAKFDQLKSEIDALKNRKAG